MEGREESRDKQEVESLTTVNRVLTCETEQKSELGWIARSCLHALNRIHMYLKRYEGWKV